jgi:hypothetical protein
MIITLLDGTTVDSTHVTFDPGSYHFYADTIDITDQLYQSDKVTLGGSAYDKKTDNIRLSNQVHPDLNHAGSESVTTNFLDNVNNEVQTVAANGAATVNAAKTGLITPLAIILVASVVLVLILKD